MSVLSFFLGFAALFALLLLVALKRAGQEIENHERLAAAFREWLRRYDEDPSQFNCEGDYGDNCATYLRKLLSETR